MQQRNRQPGRSVIVGLGRTGLALRPGTWLRAAHA